MSHDIRIPSRVSATILKALSAGVVPRIGLEHIAVGRREEIESIIEDLENIKMGGAGFRFFIGRFGSGKSFLIQLIRNYAMQQDFVVCDVDLSPERRFIGAGEKGVATYRELMKNLSTKTRPNGGALTAILEKWISSIQSEVVAKGIKPQDTLFTEKVDEKILEAISTIKDLVHGFDFANVISTYWHGHRTQDDSIKEAALKWLRGEYPTKTEARNAIRCLSIIITDDNWYDYIKLMARFVTEIGYKGLLVFFDEAVNLYKITHTTSRVNNYEKLLTMYNDTLQGKAEYLGVFIGGTPQFLEDKRRGLYSYKALHSRLVGSRFLKEGIQDFSGPVIKLERLTLEEIFVLLTKIIVIHEKYYSYKSLINDSEIQEFIKIMVSRIGADKLLTPREFVREFIFLLNQLRKQADKKTLLELISGEDFRPQETLNKDDEVSGTEYEEFQI